MANLTVKKINGIDIGNRFISQNGGAIKLVINGDLIAPEIRATKVNDIPFSDYMRKVSMFVEEIYMELQLTVSEASNDRKAKL